MPARAAPTRLKGLRALTLCLAALAAASCGNPAVAPTAAPTTSPTLAATSARPSAAPSAASACASLKLAQMTEQQRVGQLFLLGIAGDRLSAAETQVIQAEHLGGVWLENRRTGGVASIAALSAAIQALATISNTADVRFLIAADQEGGLVQRLNGPGFSTIPSALDQGQLTPAELEAAAASWGRQLSDAGINLDLGPVMDVVPPGSDADNQPIGALQREFGHDPTTVGSRGVAIVQGMAEAGVATTLKHFPGLGRVVGNTDFVAGVTDSTTTADDPYLASFRSGIDAGAPFVMISLATYSAIDPDHQAVFSASIIQTLLRDGLGFDGVVVSDDLGAATAVSAMSPGDRATAFLAAGGDLVVVAGASDATQMAAAVLSRAKSDATFAAAVDTAALRVLRAKEALGLLRCG